MNPSTPSVPAIVVLPVALATVNLLVLIKISPAPVMLLLFKSKSPPSCGVVSSTTLASPPPPPAASYVTSPEVGS